MHDNQKPDGKVETVGTFKPRRVCVQWHLLARKLDDNALRFGIWIHERQINLPQMSSPDVVLHRSVP